MKRRDEQRRFRNQTATHGERALPQRASLTKESQPGPPTAQAENTHLYGVAPVVEALRAGQRAIERVTIAEGARHGRLRELIELARKANVPVNFAPRGELQRLVGAEGNHQGVVASIAAARYRDADE